MTALIKTWTHKKLRYYAIHTSAHGYNWYIIDENGAIYGSFMTIDKFRKAQRSPDPSYCAIGEVNRILVEVKARIKIC